METIKLNLIPSGVNPICHCSQYDNGRVIRLELFDGLTPYALASGDVVTLNVRKPDNTIVTGTVSTTQDNNYVDIVTTEQICAVVGENLCDLTITNGETVIGTLNFIMTVERDVLADGIPSQSVIEDLDALVQEAVGDNYYTKTETDNLLDAKADKSTTYTKTETDNLLSEKADASAVATALDGKADVDSVYTKSETDTLLNAKANSSDVYTKAQVDTALESKADVDGDYKLMTVGNAEQLKSSVGEVNKTPYNFRTSGGSLDIGDRETDKIVGGTIAFNQLQNKKDTDQSKSENNVTFTDNRDASYTINTTAEGATSNTYVSLATTNIIANHKYLIQGAPSSSSLTTYYLYITMSNIIVTCNDTGNGGITEGLGNGEARFVIMVKSGAIITTPIIFKPQLFDLTQMFGSTIADYIYSLEQGNAGAGVAWFKKLFPKSYYAYNAGELMSVKTSAHNMVGFNAYNNATGKAKLLGGVEYQITGAYTSLAYTDINGGSETITPDLNGKFTPTSNGELTVTGGDATNTCVHIVWDGERDGDFEPYELNSYALDSDLELRGIPKLDANNNLYYDGDTYESDGNVKRRYIKRTVDGDTLAVNSVALHSGSGLYYCMVNLSPYQSLATNSILAFSRYFTNNGGVAKGNGYITSAGTLLVIVLNDQTITTKEAANAWLANNPFDIVYELATPTTEQADAYQNPQIVNDFGTEEYVDTRSVAIPVGHETFYQANLKAKLEMAPDAPENNGDYLMRHNNGENTYIPYTSPIPSAPTEDGTYTLKVTVSGGTPALTWVQDT
jgi:hypothetical protein